MSLRLLSASILVTFVFFAIFGLFLPVGHGHAMPCLYSPGGAALCSMPLAHLQHWSSAFTLILLQLLVVVAAIGLFRVNVPTPRPVSLVRKKDTDRPTLMQELFSRGILNRKEDQF